VVPVLSPADVVVCSLINPEHRRENKWEYVGISGKFPEDRWGDVDFQIPLKLKKPTPGM
jgi:hypothetical protein